MKRTFAIFMLMVIETILVIMISYGQTKATNLTAVVPCDPKLMDHIYHSKRLVVKQACITVTGIFTDASHGRNKDGCRHEADGDGHCWLKLDVGQDGLLNDINRSKQDGNLVIEPICRYPVTQADAKSACSIFGSTGNLIKSWHQDLALPPIGSHVRITGAFVFDSQHGHNEIHPVTEIKVIR